MTGTRMERVLPPPTDVAPLLDRAREACARWPTAEAPLRDVPRLLDPAHGAVLDGCTAIADPATFAMGFFWLGLAVGVLAALAAWVVAGGLLKPCAELAADLVRARLAARRARGMHS